MRFAVDRYEPNRYSALVQRPRTREAANDRWAIIFIELFGSDARLPLPAGWRSWEFLVGEADGATAERRVERIDQTLLSEGFFPARILNATGHVEINMDDATGIDAPGPFEARYLAFLETITHLRPNLHRYCSRMTGSVLDGEDVVQDALFQAYRKLEMFDDDRQLAPWLFRIAHNRCIDFLRRREVRQEAELAAMEPDSFVPADPHGPILDRAVERLVLSLPPKERACVLLKDVLDYSLEEIAELVDSTVGGVKAALNRGRSKLASMPQPLTVSRPASPEMSRLLHLYVERFNQRDWNGLRQLITADARLLVADRFAGPLVDAPYFGRYERMTIPWRMAVGAVDGQPAVIALRQDNGEWVPHSIVRVHVVDHLVARVVDYRHCPWLLPATTSVVVEPLQRPAQGDGISSITPEA